jgi:hypothetical protein
MFLPDAERKPNQLSVMAGLVPAIHVFDSQGEQDVDARAISAFTRVFRRAMRGHDEPLPARPGAARPPVARSFPSIHSGLVCHPTVIKPS